MREQLEDVGVDGEGGKVAYAQAGAQARRPAVDRRLEMPRRGEGGQGNGLERRLLGRKSVRAATRVNAEQAPKRSMCRPTRLQLRGRLIRLGEMSEDDAQSLHRGTGAMSTNSDVYPVTAVVHSYSRALSLCACCRCGVAERFVVPRKPGNSGGGKGPQFKTDAERGEGHGDWATYQLHMMFRNCRWRRTRQTA